MAKLLFTTTEAAAELRVTSARVRQMVLKGELAAEKFGRDLVITAEAVTKAKKRKTTPGPLPVCKGNRQRKQVDQGSRRRFQR
jgi:excisionase family DNA binding protein